MKIINSEAKNGPVGWNGLRAQTVGRIVCCNKPNQRSREMCLSLFRKNNIEKILWNLLLIYNCIFGVSNLHTVVMNSQDVFQITFMLWTELGT